MRHSSYGRRRACKHTDSPDFKPVYNIYKKSGTHDNNFRNFCPKDRNGGLSTAGLHVYYLYLYLHQLGNPELNLFCETGTEMDCGIDSIDLYVNSREEESSDSTSSKKRKADPLVTAYLNVNEKKLKHLESLSRSVTNRGLEFSRVF